MYDPGTRDLCTDLSFCSLDESKVSRVEARTALLRLHSVDFEVNLRNIRRLNEPIDGHSIQH